MNKPRKKPEQETGETRTKMICLRVEDGSPPIPCDVRSCGTCGKDCWVDLQSLPTTDPEFECHQCVDPMVLAACLASDDDSDEKILANLQTRIRESREYVN